MDFSIEGPRGPGLLLPRGVSAERQLAYLTSVLDEAGEALDRDVSALVAATLAYTGEWFEHNRPHFGFLADYLEEGLGRRVEQARIDEWQAAGDRCRAVLRPRLDRFRGYSAPECPALALPALFDQGAVASDDQASRALGEYADLLERQAALAESDDTSSAVDFLNALADYGNHYDLMAVIEAPLDEAFLVKIEERRNLRLSFFRNRGTQELVVADARTNHVTFKVLDPSARIAEFEALTPDLGAAAYGLMQIRTSEQYRSIYAHDERDYRVRFQVRLALLRRLQAVPVVVAITSLLLAAGLAVEGATDLRTLVLATAPVTLAVSLLYVREPTTLASRLRTTTTIALVLSLVALLATSVSLFVAAHM